MKKLNNRTFAVLGLGIFGSTVAKTLSEYNCEVIAVDLDIKCVDRMADICTSANQGDITDLETLRAAGIGDCDVAVVAVGSHLEESIMAIMNLHELKVPYIVAKAKNKRYMEILKAIGADKVIRPEKEMGERVAKSLLSQNIVDMIDIDDTYSVVEMNAPRSWVGKSLIELDARRKFGINVLGIRKSNESRLSISPSAEYVIAAEDHLLVIAEMQTFEKFEVINSI